MDPQVGHTVEVLYCIYTHCLDGDDERCFGRNRLLASLRHPGRWRSGASADQELAGPTCCDPFRVFRELRQTGASGGT